jgi:hypothetical protein
METDTEEMKAQDLIKFPVKYSEGDDDDAIIFDADGNIFAEIRGFGKLQYDIHSDGSKTFVGYDVAAERQNLIGQFVAEAINSRARPAQAEQLETENQLMRELLEGSNYFRIGKYAIEQMGASEWRVRQLQNAYYPFNEYFTSAFEAYTELKKYLASRAVSS